MTFSDAISVAVLSILFYFCGALFIFKTKMLVERGQKNHEKYLVIRKYFHVPDMTLNPRYATYIRCAGVFVWLWALAFDCLVLYSLFHHQG